jgi:superfamily II DNA/RNA helicase
MENHYENAAIEEITKLLKSGKSVLGIAQPTSYENDIPKILLEMIPKPEEGSPRAIVFCKDVSTAIKVHEITSIAAKKQDLTVDLIHEKGNKLKQRNDLFDGTEIIIGTPKRICELYFQNGFNIGKLKLLVVLQIDEMMRAGNKGYILRIAESLPKCRHLIFTCNSDEERTIDYIDQFVEPITKFEFEN